MTAYYNEIDPKAAAWIRELIKQGHIAPGDVDERSIIDVRPDDLRGYTQCHFFAGIGVWSYALRSAGWPDSRSVWTGSCPCQPFSSAGKGDEFADERHLWPAWFRLIRERRPDVVFGEQVSSKDALAWFDHVRFDLESAAYAVGVLDTCAAGVGAPHIRQRLYFVADAGRASRCSEFEHESGRESRWGASASHGSGAWARSATGVMAEPASSGRGAQSWRNGGENRRPAPEPGRLLHAGELGDAEIDGIWTLNRESSQSDGQKEPAGGSGVPIVMGDTGSAGSQARQPEILCGPGRRDEGRAIVQPGPTNGFWRDAEWIACRDGKARPVEPGVAPLVTGATSRVVKLRGYGNAINAEQAKTFIEVAMECIA